MPGVEVDTPRSGVGGRLKWLMCRFRYLIGGLVISKKWGFSPIDLGRSILQSSNASSKEQFFNSIAVQQPIRLPSDHGCPLPFMRHVATPSGCLDGVDYGEDEILLPKPLYGTAIHQKVLLTTWGGLIGRTQGVR